MKNINKIISGGQTGVDRIALDWAIQRNIPHAGWCPKGGRAEDGVIPDHYILRETESNGYMQRTKQNIRDSDGTLIISWVAELTGGSQFTYEYATKIVKPCLHVYPESDWQDLIKLFIEKQSILVLNVAGPRSSNAPHIEPFVFIVLDEVMELAKEES